MKNAIAAFVSIAVIAGSAWFWYARWRGSTEISTRPNILVISTCSLRHDAVESMPNVNRFFSQGSYVFKNAFNGLGWTAIFAVTAPEIRNRWFGQVGYRAGGVLIKNHMYLIPFRNSWKLGYSRKEKKEGVPPPDSNFEKNYRQNFDEFVDNTTISGRLPYFVIAQLKYPHYPLIDRFNADSGWDQFLDAQEKKRIETYLAAPERFSAKLPFLLMLTNDSHLLKAHPKISKAMKEAHAQEGSGHDSAFLGLLTTPSFLGDWMKSPDYELDLQILKKIYRANVLYLDKIIGEMLNRIEARGDLKNTVVIFVGDHGEVHMERGHLTHGTSWYDPALRVPLMIRFPEQSKSQIFESQTNFFTLTKIITGIAEGKITSRSLPEKLESISDKVLIGRDCSNTWRALRYDNKWKYVVDNSSGESWLFDLQADPEETKNLVGDKPEVVAEMEALYWQRLPRLSNQMVNTCDPWPGPKPLREDPVKSN